MANRSERKPPGMMDLVVTNKHSQASPQGDKPSPAEDVADIAAPPVGEMVERRPSLAHREGVIDWRTIDPARIRGEGVPVEELLHYREKLDELLREAQGKYVLIVGREIISLFDDLETAAMFSAKEYRGRTVLIKKIAAVEPIHTLGGAVLGITGADQGKIG